MGLEIGKMVMAIDELSRSHDLCIQRHHLSDMPPLRSRRLKNIWRKQDVSTPFTIVTTREVSSGRYWPLNISFDSGVLTAAGRSRPTKKVT